MSISTIKKEVSKLNKLEQAELMHFMIELLTKDDFSLSSELKKELDKREKALNDGLSKGRPAREVIAK